MREVKIRDIANVYSGNSAPQNKNDFSLEGIPFIRASSLDFLEKGGDLDNCEKISLQDAKRLKLKLFPANSIVFAKSGMSAKMGRIYLLERNAYVVSHLAVIVPKKGQNISSLFLKYYFKKFSPVSLIRDSAYPSIRLSDIENWIIRIPAFVEQLEIANILLKTENLVNQRKQSIETLEALVKSVFLEMFGDPKLNDKYWPRKKIGKIIDSTQYGVGRKSNDEAVGMPMLRMNNITYAGNIDLKDIKWIELSEEEREKYNLKKRDLLFNRTNSPELVGKTAVWEFDEAFTFAGYLVRIRFKESEINPYFVSAYLNSKYGKQLLYFKAKPSNNMSNISPSLLERLEIVIPPIELQNKYELVVKAINQRKEEIRKSLVILETLFQSLLQKAFRGELILNNSEYSFQKAVTDLNWFEEQLQTMQPYGFSSEIIKVLAEIRDKEEIETIDDLSEALKENHFPEINEIVDLKELLYSFGVTLLCEVDDQKQIQQLISHPALQHTNIDLAFNKLLKERKLEREKVNQEIIKENDRTLRFMNRTLFQEMLFGDEQVNLAHFIHESFQDKEFTVSGIMERLRAKQALQGKKASEVKNDVFALIQKFIKTEFVDLPFTFQELYRRLREKLFCPSFDLLHEFVVIELDRKPGLLQMYYPGDMANQFPKHFQHLQNEKASNKLYLIATYGNSQD